MKIQVKIKPNAKQQTLEEMADGRWLIQLKSAPVEGKANQELIKLLAKHFHVTQTNILIKMGLNSRNKVIEIQTDSV